MITKTENNELCRSTSTSICCRNVILQYNTIKRQYLGIRALRWITTPTVRKYLKYCVHSYSSWLIKRSFLVLPKQNVYESNLYLCVRGIDFASPYDIYFGNVPTIWYFIVFYLIISLLKVFLHNSLVVSVLKNTIYYI